MLTKKYYDGFIVHDILNKHLDDGHKILELLTAFADADGVDAVEVVRCKDCIRWRQSKSNTAAKVCDWDRYEKTENDYCSWAKRKDNDTR